MVPNGKFLQNTKYILIILAAMQVAIRDLPSMDSNILESHLNH